jgi:hypothetical protein
MSEIFLSAHRADINVFVRAPTSGIILGMKACSQQRCHLFEFFAVIRVENMDHFMLKRVFHFFRIVFVIFPSQPYKLISYIVFAGCPTFPVKLPDPAKWQGRRI